MFALLKLSGLALWLVISVAAGAALVIWQIVTDILFRKERQRNLNKMVEQAKAEVASRKR